ncbi:hypothetical protein LRS13_09265 [Svornostia abyssi]|uniref:Glycosyltransferase n=1 Tax=Svornostia abyssi TaxID=2898438 RepID=A0ABY5PM54_9ACTN|nr:hypothetical protein LRS13_09265 [Parviterribacteraceae bacterium J379]
MRWLVLAPLDETPAPPSLNGALSVCIVTAGPPSAVEAILSPFRRLGAEVVIACDDRMPDTWRDACSELADEILPVRFTILEDHLQEMHAACTGDWILRLDSDEVPSQALLAALPEIVERRDVDQVTVPRRWLTPDAEGWYDEVPWAPDLQIRFARRASGPVFTREVHLGIEVSARMAYREEPLYHAKSVLCSLEDRRRTWLSYEVRNPAARTVGGRPMEMLFEPELHVTLPPQPVPAADAPLIDALLAGHGRDAPRRRRKRAPSAARVMTGLAGASAECQPIGRDHRFLAGEHREDLWRVTNRSDEVWPEGGRDRSIFVASRWRFPDGTVVEGRARALSAPLAPGETEIVSVPLDVPDRPGSVDLAVDVVEEGVRWYGSPTIQRAQIRPPLPAPDRREEGTRRTGPDAPQIPRVLHMIWLGGQPLPPAGRACLESWRQAHPAWDIRLWTDKDAPRPPAVALARNLAEAADIIRYAIMRDHGGVYVDTDVECLRPIDDLLAGVSAFAAYEVPGRLCNAVIGSVPGHPAFALACELVETTAGTGHYPEATATLFLTRVLERFPDVTLFGPERFYPYLWDEARPRDVVFPDAYAVHHWAKSWAADGE